MTTLISEVAYMQGGVDEAGRGPVLGPLVIAACAVPLSDVPLLVEAGVRDSKLLTAAKRASLAEWFTSQQRERAWRSHTVVIDADEIDVALAQDGLNWLEVRGFARAIEGLGVTRDLHVVADACDVNAERFTQRITERLDGWPWPNANLDSEHKADTNHPVVAMASVLAKHRRDQAMTAMAERVGFPVGSGYPSDPTTVAALDRLIGHDAIDADVRWSWATVQRHWAQRYPGSPPVRGQPHRIQRTLFDTNEPRP